MLETNDEVVLKLTSQGPSGSLGVERLDPLGAQDQVEPTQEKTEKRTRLFA